MTCDPPEAKDDWSMSQEREFMENLLCQRIDFFLVVFGGVLIGSFAISNPGQQFFVLCSGTLIATLLALTIIQIQRKVNKILTKLCMMSPPHPVAVIEKAVGGKADKGRSLIGYLVPSLCLVIMILGMVFSARNWYQSANSPSTHPAMSKP